MIAPIILWLRYRPPTFCSLHWDTDDLFRSELVAKQLFFPFLPFLKALVSIAIFAHTEGEMDDREVHQILDKAMQICHRVPALNRSAHCALCCVVVARVNVD